MSVESDVPGTNGLITKVYSEVAAAAAQTPAINVETFLNNDFEFERRVNMYTSSKSSL